MKHLNVLILMVFGCGMLFVVNCARPQGDTPQEKRDFVLQMKQSTLQDLYADKPWARELIQNAAGYGVFSNINTQLLLVGTGNGYGVLIDNSNGDKTYMRMAEAGVGLGVALKDFREVVVFNSKQKFYDFWANGWNMGVQGDAAAKYKDEGEAVTGEVALDSDVLVFQLTESGIALRANFGASKYWPDKDLN